MKTLYYLIVSFFLVACLPVSVYGHAFAPSLLELREAENNQLEVRWKQPVIRASGSGALSPILPKDCSETGDMHRSEKEGSGLVEAWKVICLKGIIGESIGVEGIAESRANVLLRLVLTDGRSIRHVLTPESPYFTVPEQEGVSTVMVSYGWIGIEHILMGFDHLLFVLGLVLLVHGGKRLVATITSFTIGHSVTLALAVLGWIHVPQPPIEAGIAFSIYILAIHIVPGDEQQSSRSWINRFPWVMAGLFGLLHGLGFAGALAEVGLPDGEIPLALFSFNIGIELGQLAFVLVVWGIGIGIHSFSHAWLTRPVQWIPPYVIGSLAIFWFFQRVQTSLVEFNLI